jgi:hypothetical protein
LIIYFARALCIAHRANAIHSRADNHQLL